MNSNPEAVGAPPPAPAPLNAAVFILTQNTEARRAYLKTTLYFLFKHWNARYRYPVVLFHEGDYDAFSQREILLGIRSECRDLVSFVALDPEDFVMPSHINAAKLADCLDTRPVPYWRNDKYRLMCRWWIVEMPKYAAGYDYVMRLDDDSLIEEPIHEDLFRKVANRNAVYAGNIIHQDCGICCYGMRDFFMDQISAGFAAGEMTAEEAEERRGILSGIFTAQELPMKSVSLHPFRQLLSLLGGTAMPTVGEKLTVYAPTMFFNNYHITATAFWKRPDVQRVVRAFDLDGRWAYVRWGDSPIQSIIVMLFARPEQITNTKFAYSKRLGREAFVGQTVTGAREIYAYVPAKYTESSCITEQVALTPPATK